MDIKKRVKVGCHQGNLIAGGPVVPNYDGMSVAEAHEAKQTYLTQRKKSGMAYDGRRYKQGRVLRSKIMTTPGTAPQRYVL